MKRFKVSQFYKLYNEYKTRYYNGHADTDAMMMITCYGIYKGLGGRQNFCLTGRDYVDRSKVEHMRSECNRYIKYIDDYISFYSLMLLNNWNYGFAVTRTMKDSYNTLIKPHLDMRDERLLRHYIVESDRVPAQNKETVRRFLMLAKKVLDEQIESRNAVV